MRQIFISYAQEDEAFAVILAGDLRQGGARVWLDVQDAEPGRNWARSIEQALAESTMMLVILSPDALVNSTVMGACQAYLDAHRPVIPVVLRPCDLPDSLGSRRPVDFTQTSQYNQARYSRVLHKLTTRLIEDGLKSRRSDPVIWTFVDHLRDTRADSAGED
ncbi:MAG: toll/interleukin-1 receptor domain-containing protein [Anaerolineae bacterium]|nr:toll/interleukin-1 receptor domain-containing protein [Anaerolineae bacterium]